MLSLSDLVTVGGVAVIVTLLTQAIKQWIPAGLVALVALALGLAIALLAGLALGHQGGESLGNDALAGLLGGAAAVGLYGLQKPVKLLPPKA